MSVSDTFCAAVRAFARGETAASELERFGVFVVRKGPRVEIDNRAQKSCLVGPEDVAKGHWKYLGDRDTLRAWAELVLSGSLFIELGERFEIDYRGVVLLDCLRDAAHGQDSSPNQLEIIKELSAR